MTVVVCTAHSPNYADMAAVTLPTVARYVERQGYCLFYEPNLEIAEGDACKIRLFYDLYATGNFTGDDLFFWIDTDALVMNSAVRIEDIAAKWLGEAHYLIGYDPNGINSGTWLARFTSHAEHFLRVSRNASLSMGWADQVGLFQTMLAPPFSAWVRTVPGKVMNAMPYAEYGWDWPHKNEINNYEPGDFVLHLPSMEQSRRTALLREYAKEAR